MPKITLTKPTSGYNLAAINNNFVKIEAEFQNKVLYRDNPIGEANTLQTDVDVNSKRLYNLAPGVNPNDAVIMSQVMLTPQGVEASAAAALVSATQAASSAVNAANSAIAAQTSGSSIALKADLANTVDLLKGSALVGRVSRVVDSIAQLRLLPVSGSKHAFATGYYVQGDGGGGSYFYDATDAATLDNGGTVIVAASGARWKLTQKQGIDWRQFGAKGDGVTNDTAAIQSALNTLIDTRVTAGNYIISQTLTIRRSDVSVVGAGKGGFHDFVAQEGASTLIWAGGAGGVMVDISPVANAGVRALRNNVFSNFRFLANNAAIGLVVKSSSHGEFNNFFEEFSYAGMYMGVVATLGEARDTQFNRVCVSARHFLTSGCALMLDGDAAANASLNKFELIDAQYATGAALELVNADNNVFDVVRLTRGTGTANGVRFYAGTVAELTARGNLFLDLSPGPGGVYSMGTEVAAVPAKNNTILFYDKENGWPDPVIGAGSNVAWSSNSQPLGYREFAKTSTTTKTIDSNGWITQSGSTGTIAANSSGTFTFPTPFPNACVKFSATPTSTPGPYAAAVATSSITILTGASANTFRWQAEGY